MLITKLEKFLPLGVALGFMRMKENGLRMKEKFA